jgi:hypothetical protein
VVSTTGPKFYPEVKPGPDPKQTRKVNSDGKEAKEKRTGKLSSLDLWEGYRVFRDARSPTGWIDQHRIPIVGIDTNGHALRLNLHTGKPEYVHPTPASAGSGFLGSLSKALAFSGADLGGLLLEVSGNSDLNKVRVSTGLSATTAIIGAGGLGASDLSGLTGGGGFSSLLGSPASGAGAVVPSTPARSSSSAQTPASASIVPALILAGAVVAILVLSRRR